MHDPVKPLPHFNRGVLEAIVLITGTTTGVVTVAAEEALGFELHVR
jgi:hypothetical protein